MSRLGVKHKSRKSGVLSGAFILVLAGIFCKFIGAFYRVPLSNILGAEGIGVYQLVFPIYSLFLIICSGGIPVALSKIVAECRARGEIKRGKRFLWISFFILLIVSLILAVIFIFLGERIANLQGNSLAGLGYIAVGIALVFSSILTAFRGYFQGFQIMHPTAVSQVVEQIFKLLLGLLFASIFIKNGIAFGVLGALLGIAISELFALVYLIITYAFKRKKIDLIEPKILTPFWADFWLILKRSLVITLNSLILPLIIAVDSFLVVNLLSKSGYSLQEATSLFGVYSGMVNSLVNFPTVVAYSISIAILPWVSYEREKGATSMQDISSCFKLILIVCVPCIMLFLLFSQNIISLLYPSTTSQELILVANNLLKILSINILTISILQLTTSMMQAVNKSYIPLINLSIAGAIKIVLTIFLVGSPMNIYGVGVASIACYLLSSGLNFIAVSDQYNFKLKFKTVFSILLCTGITFAVMVGIYNLFGLILATNLSFILSGIISAILFVILVINSNIFTNSEIKKIPFISKLRILKRIDKEVLK